MERITVKNNVFQGNMSLYIRIIAYEGKHVYIMFLTLWNIVSKIKPGTQSKIVYKGETYLPSSQIKKLYVNVFGKIISIT